jgi:hypothetical protein
MDREYTNCQTLHDLRFKLIGIQLRIDGLMIDGFSNELRRHSNNDGSEYRRNKIRRSPQATISSEIGEALKLVNELEKNSNCP